MRNSGVNKSNFLRTLASSGSIVGTKSDGEGLA